MPSGSGGSDLFRNLRLRIRFLMMQSHFAAALLAGQDKGQLRSHDADSRALAMVSSLDSVTCYLVMCPDLKPLATARQLEAVFIDELLVQC